MNTPFEPLAPTYPVALALALTLSSTPVQAQYTNVAPDIGIDFDGTVGESFPGIQGALMQKVMGNGAAVGDYDGDGDLDVYLLGYEGFSNILLRNDLDQGTATFTDVTTEAGVGDLGLSRVAHFTDLDDDGLLDLLLINDNDLAGTHSPSKLYRNDGDGTFTDVTAGSGFEPLGYLRCGASLADYDLDGLLDIFVATWNGSAGGVIFYPGENKLYRNLGGFQFEDVTDAVGLGGFATNSFTSIFTDFDGDHRPDLYVAVDGGSDEFFWNTPAGFVNDTVAVGTTHLGNDMGVACTDFDLDGDLDMYSTNITGLDPGAGNCLYQNAFDSSGTTSFANTADALGLADTHWGWGVEFTDYDSDGLVDIFTVTGFDDFIAQQHGTHHPLYQTPMVFFRATETGFVRYPGIDADDSRALITFDYDRDGDEDALITNVNGPARLLENITSTNNHWLGVAVRQTTGNHFGIGVTVRVTVGDVTQRREILAGESYLAGTPAEVHFGLGAATTADEVRIEWTSGHETVYTNVPADQLVTFVEGAAESYGCGLNPPGSLSVLSGSPQVGTTVEFGVDNPMGTQASGSLPFLALSGMTDVGFPCGTPLPGFGMESPYTGELLISSPPALILAGPLWTGAGSPAPIPISIPNNGSLVGATVYFQGILIDETPAALVPIGLTEGLAVTLGSL